MITLALVSIAAFAATAEPFDSRGWKWESPITIDAARGEPAFARVSLSPEVLDRAMPSLQDLRIVDDRGLIVPHAQWQLATAPLHSATSVDVQIINKTFEPTNTAGGYVRATLDFGQRVPKNRIELDTNGDNFRRRVGIEGSNDNSTFERILEDGYLFDIHVDGVERYTLREVNFPANDFRYLRVTIHATPDDPRRIDLLAARAARVEVTPDTPEIPVPTQTIENDTPPPARHSEHVIDLGYRNLPAVRLTIRVDDSAFYRGYELLGRNGAEETVEQRMETGGTRAVTRPAPWQHVTSGVLCRIPDTPWADRAEIIVTRPYRYLKLRIANGDDQPLAVRGVDAARPDTRILFPAATDRSYLLLVGNAEAAAPDYDLSRAHPELRNKPHLNAALGAVREHPVYTPQQSWLERNQRMLLTTAIGVAALVVLIVVGRSFRALAPPTSG